MPVSTNIILSDIAILKYEPEERRHITRVNGKPAMAVTITKESSANTVAVCNQVEAMIEQWKSDPELENFELRIFMNQGGIVMTQLDTLYTTGRIGAFLAALVLYMFLRRLRITCLLYTSPSPRDATLSRMPSSA